MTIEVKPVGYCSEYGLTTLASKAHHYCLSVSKKAENEFQFPLFSTPPTPPAVSRQPFREGYHKDAASFVVKYRIGYRVTATPISAQEAREASHLLAQLAEYLECIGQ